MTIPGDSVISVSSLSDEPIAAAVPPVIASPTNIQRKTRCRKVESGRATATGGCAAYSMRPEAYVRVGTPARFIGLERTEILGVAVPVATTVRSRLLGLALLRRERAGAGLLIPRCRSVHTFGMRFPIDVLFLDEADRVIELRRVGAAVPAHTLPGRHGRARAALSVDDLDPPNPGRTGAGGCSSAPASASSC